MTTDVLIALCRVLNLIAAVVLLVLCSVFTLITTAVMVILCRVLIKRLRRKFISK